MRLDLRFELLRLFRELRSKSLEFLKLHIKSILSPTISRIPITCCFQLSTSSKRKLFLLVTFCSSVSIRPLRLIKSCQASMASREYWFLSRTISLRCRSETLVISGFLTAPPNIALIPVLRPIFSHTWSRTDMTSSWFHHSGSWMLSTSPRMTII